MTVAGVWLPTSRFADLAGISRQAAARILKSAYRGEPWNDATLAVRPVLSRGGRSGLAHEVSAETLPLTLRLQQFSPAGPVPPPRQTSYADPPKAL